MTRQFDDEPYAIRVLQGVQVAADALYHAAKSDDERAGIENLLHVFDGLLTFCGAQTREMKHFVEEKQRALDALESANAVIREWASAAEAVADSPDVLAAKLDELVSENERLNATVQELESVAREAARS